MLAAVTSGIVTVIRGFKFLRSLWRVVRRKCVRAGRCVEVWYLYGLLGEQCPLGLRKAALLLCHVLERLVQTCYEALKEGAVLKSGAGKETGRECGSRKEVGEINSEIVRVSNSSSRRRKIGQKCVNVI